ncbi:MAG: FIST C-terminal domain-containing protein [Treponema sp.]|jgi:hypothetical protein|nr:FIST C-terminal domain-containing protein [Treponema sp.]
MLKSITVFTEELDDPQAAARELREKLEGFALLPHSAGVIFCTPDFVSEGVYEAVAKSLPFPVVGATTLSQSTNSGFGEFMLTLTVLTGDDVVFGAGQSGAIPAPGGAEETLRPAVEQAKAQLGGAAPKMALTFCPTSPAGSPNDRYVDALTKLTGGIPVFGGISLDYSVAVTEDAYCFYNDHAAKDRAVVLLIGGALKPRFFFATLLDDTRLPYAGEITGARDANVCSINGESAITYFERAGFAANGSLAEGFRFMPALLDVSKVPGFEGVPPFFRNFQAANPDGSVYCMGLVPQGSTFTLSRLDAESCERADAELIERVKKAAPDARAVFVISCDGRRLALMLDKTRGIRFFHERLKDYAPFVSAYSAGEICPLLHDETRTVNRLQMFTTAICVL